MENKMTIDEAIKICKEFGKKENEAGEPYTTLSLDGIEYYSCPTSEENEMFKYLNVYFLK